MAEVTTTAYSLQFKGENYAEDKVISMTFSGVKAAVSNAEIGALGTAILNNGTVYEEPIKAFTEVHLITRTDKSYDLADLNLDS